MIKRLAALLCCAVLLCACALSEGAYSARVDDRLGLLTEYGQSKLTAVMEKLTEYGDVVFLSGNESGSADALAEQYFDREISPSSDHSGVIFYINMRSRLIVLFVRGEFEKRVGHAGAYAITDNVYTYATKGDYLTCAVKAFEQVETLMRGQRIFSPMRVICTLLLALSFALIASYLIIRRASLHRARKTTSATLNAHTQVQMQIGSPRLVSRQKRRRQSSSGGGGGGFRGGGGGGGFHGGGGSSGSHGF